MSRTRDYGSIIVAHLSVALIAFAQLVVNKVNISFWYRQPHLDFQATRAIPLTLEGLIYFLIYNGLCALTYVSFLRAAFADPGRIPDGTTAPFKSEHFKMEMIKVNGKETWKPPRAHYCVGSGIYIFKLDHYCPWINNAVGHKNTKFFMQFLFYLLLTALMTIVLIVRTIVAFLKLPRAKVVMNEDGFVAACVLDGIVLVMALGALYVAFELLRE